MVWYWMIFLLVKAAGEQGNSFLIISPSKILELFYYGSTYNNDVLYFLIIFFHISYTESEFTSPNFNN